MRVTIEELNQKMKENGGYLDLEGCTGLTQLPDNLTVGGSLDLRGCTGLTQLPDNLTVPGFLYLRGCTGLTQLPDNLTVAGSLYLEGCTGLTQLPDNLTVPGSLDLRGCTGLTQLPDNLTVGGSLYLEGCTGLTQLPDNLTVAGSLYLEGCIGLTQLPDNLTVGGYLDLRGCTGLTQLPDNLTVAGSLYLGGCTIKNPGNYKHLIDGEYKPNKYIYADGILTHVKRKSSMGKYTYYIGKIKGENVLSDGTFFVHCQKFSDGVKDLEFKKCKSRGAEQYASLTKDSVISREDAINMYRVITGACRQGTQAFVDSLQELKEKYTIGEIIELTKGHYGASVFENFFERR